MTLAERLRRLDAASGRPSAITASESPSLMAQLQRLRPGRNPAIRRPEVSIGALARLLGGEEIGSGLIHRRQHFALDQRHGSWRLRALVETPIGFPNMDVEPPQRLLFLDTETTGLSIGTGTLVSLAGVAWLEGEALSMSQYLLAGIGAEASLLERLFRLGDGFTAIVTFNGRRFDLPLLATRARINAIEDRFSGMPQIDLLYPLRRAFASRWSDCRLATAELRLLGVERDADLPGAMAPAAWRCWLQYQDHSQLPALLRHNAWDLLTLAVLLPVLSHVLREPWRFDADLLSIARCLERAGREEGAMRLLESAAPDLGPAGGMELARLKRRQNHWAQASAIWSRLAAQGYAPAIEKLAQYQEHVRKDYLQALVFARRLPINPANRRRVQRLSRKQSRKESAKPEDPGIGSDRLASSPCGKNAASL